MMQQQIQETGIRGPWSLIIFNNSVFIHQNIIEKAIINVIKKTNIKAIIKIFSAIFSLRTDKFSLLERIDKNERIALAIKKIVPIPVNSSIIETALYFDILREVKTTKQNPNKLEEVFKMCSDLLLAIKFNVL
jgi:hypothetical protein